MLLEVTDGAGDRREGSRVCSFTVVDTGDGCFVEFLKVVVYIGDGSGYGGEQFAVGCGRSGEIDKSFLIFGGWLGFVGMLLDGHVAGEAGLFGCVKLVTEQALGTVEVGFEICPCFSLLVAFGVPGFAIFEI